MEAIDPEEPSEQVEVVDVDAMEEDWIDHVVDKDNKIKEMGKDVNQNKERISELDMDMSRKEDEIHDLQNERDEIKSKITMLDIITTGKSLIRRTTIFLWDKIKQIREISGTYLRWSRKSLRCAKLLGREPRIWKYN